MKLNARVKTFLENHSSARERRNRYSAVWAILYDMYGKDMWGKETFLVVGPQIFSIVRLINQVQQFNKELRGNDYGDGKVLAQEKQIELGYTPGHNRDLKTLDEFFPVNNKSIYEDEDEELDFEEAD